MKTVLLLIEQTVLLMGWFTNRPINHHSYNRPNNCRDRPINTVQLFVPLMGRFFYQCKKACCCTANAKENQGYREEWWRGRALSVRCRWRGGNFWREGAGCLSSRWFVAAYLAAWEAWRQGGMQEWAVPPGYSREGLKLYSRAWGDWPNHLPSGPHPAVRRIRYHWGGMKCLYTLWELHI